MLIIINNAIETRRDMIFVDDILNAVRFMLIFLMNREEILNAPYLEFND